MKHMLTASLMILIYFTASATNIDTFFEGQQLNVTAHSGLKMRIQPGLHHESIKVIPYGDLVQVVHLDESKIIKDRVDWIDGHWIMVAHGEDVGYVFDGFLTELAIPRHDYEFVQFDMDLIYPLESWAGLHLFETDVADTLSMENLSKVTHRYEGGDKMVRLNTGQIYKVQLYLTGIRIMDAYHLLEGMLTTKHEIEKLHDNSIFIEARDGTVQHVKINLENPVDIKKMDNGQVRISIHSTGHDCTL